jgi:hypothetical protein
MRGIKISLFVLLPSDFVRAGKRKIMVREDGSAAHTAGYFELINKSDFVCCVRVFQGGSEPLREASLPSYTTRE